MSDVIRAHVDDRQLLDVARELLETADLSGAVVVRGQFHDVVLVEGVAAVRVAHGELEELRRATELVRRLDDLGFPYALPVPLSDVQVLSGRPTVATAWVDGQAHLPGSGESGELRRILDALAGVPLDEIADVAAEPHSYAGGPDWYDLMMEQAIPRLPMGWRSEAQRRIDAAQGLTAVPPSLVHGDLAGDNMRWDSGGRLVGILDWDLAAPWDPAVDVACLSWHGWDAVRGAVDEATYVRARVWADTFGIEQIVASLPDGPAAVAKTAARAVEWLERTSRT